ncbi:Lysine-specific demethylase 3A-B [Trichinella pseudospiralis]|uniref:Lysine-specific demethylase 3A-B n=1 Tax=Trichinella pseudospiralis TaxID=6337 RepID=A0A0V1FTM8_TRIPS|nr:Lysine-specific demethylase 3A-B [Trichinella pseudospiralis]
MNNISLLLFDRTIYKRAFAVSIGIDKANLVVNLQTTSPIFFSFLRELKHKFPFANEINSTCFFISFEIVSSDMATPVKRNRRNGQQDQDSVPGSGEESQNLELEPISQSEGGEVTEEVANSNGQQNEQPTDPDDEYEFQSKVCTEISNMPLCVECFYYPKPVLCRFIYFRQLGYGSQEGRYRFPTNKSCYDKAKASSEQPVRPNTETPTESRQLTQEQCVYTLFHTQHLFWDVLKAEQRFRNEFRKATCKSESDIALKMLESDRELCDVCWMSIFNIHAFCRRCGFSVCMQCYSKHLNDNQYDEYKWYDCTDINRVSHNPAAMDLCHFHEELHPSKLKETMKKLDGKFAKFSGVLMNGGRKKRRLPNVKHFYTNKRNLLVLQEPDNERNILYFRKHWRNALPVLVQNVKTTSEYWRPSFFRQQLRSGASEHDLLDCRSGELLYDVPYLKFWNGFDDRRKRMRDSDCNTTRHLKFKEWPANNTLPRVLPSACADFYSATPMPSYVHLKNAAFNLASYLPDSIKPNLGPKLCIAYEMFPNMNAATTNLHSEVTDVLNILTWTSIPKNMSKQRMHDDILRVLAKEGLDAQMMNMARKRINDVGALWTIFKPGDSDKLRQYMIQYFGEADEPGGDPIHDISHYLNAKVRADLVKNGIQPITFLQMRNDALYIPAGAPHQVLNLKCCIQVTLDFVSPEGVNRSLKMLNELRKLAFRNTELGDKIQLHNIVYYSTLEAIETLEKANSSQT